MFSTENYRYLRSLQRRLPSVCWSSAADMNLLLAVCCLLVTGVVTGQSVGSVGPLLLSLHYYRSPQHWAGQGGVGITGFGQHSYEKCKGNSEENKQEKKGQTELEENRE